MAAPPSPPPLLTTPLDVEDLLTKINAVLDFAVEYGDTGRFNDCFTLQVDWDTPGAKKDVKVLVNFTFPDDCDRNYAVWVQTTRECMRRFYNVRELLEDRFSLSLNLEPQAGGGFILIRSLPQSELSPSGRKHEARKRRRRC